jgi:hypothetical protein
MWARVSLGVRRSESSNKAYANLREACEISRWVTKELSGRNHHQPLVARSSMSVGKLTPGTLKSLTSEFRAFVLFHFASKSDSSISLRLSTPCQNLPQSHLNRNHLIMKFEYWCLRSAPRVGRSKRLSRKVLLRFMYRDRPVSWS